MNDETAKLIKHMVDRFLWWKLPSTFAPDGGVKFERIGTHEPTGTNVFTAIEAEAMVRHMLEGLPLIEREAQWAARVAALKEAWLARTGTCVTSALSSRTCERGRNGCEVKHWILDEERHLLSDESANLLNARDARTLREAADHFKALTEWSGDEKAVEAHLRALASQRESESTTKEPE